MNAQFSHPGKLMLAGGWAVLELGVPGIVMAVDKNVTVKAKTDKTISITAPDLKLAKKEAEWNNSQLVWKTQVTMEEKEKLLIAEHAIRTTLKYLENKGHSIQAFSLQTSSEDTLIKLEDGKTAKVGFGSSGAACVAIVRAILALHGINTDSKVGLELAFKLACIGHYEAQGKIGSSVDVAASTFGGLVVYKRFDPVWLESQVKAGKNTGEIADATWPSLSIEQLPVPKNFELLIGYTGPDPSTKETIKKVHACKEEKKEEYWKTINSIKAIVEQLIPAIQKNQQNEIIGIIRKNRRALQELARISGVQLETPELASLAEIAEQNNAAGKFSGGGGGGVGIAVCFDKKTRQKIEKEWKEAGIIPVPGKIAPNQTKK